MFSKNKINKQTKNTYRLKTQKIKTISDNVKSTILYKAKGDPVLSSNIPNIVKLLRPQRTEIERISVEEIISDNRIREIIRSILEAQDKNDLKSKLEELRNELNDFISIEINDNVIEEIIRETFDSRDWSNSRSLDDFKYILKALYSFYRKVKNLDSSRRQEVRRILKRIEIFDVDYTDNFINGVHGLKEHLGEDAVLLMYELYRVLSFTRNGYSHFDDVEWFLVLVSRWARININNGYLPICPTKRHTSTLRLYLIYYNVSERSISLDRARSIIENLIGFNSRGS